MTNAERIARRARVGRTVFVVAFGLIALGTTFAIYRGEDTRQIINASPCVDEPNSRECQKVREAVLRAEDPSITCIIFRNVGYPCPNPDAKPRNASSREGNYSNEQDPTQGGGRSNTGNPPPSQPGPPQSGPPDSGDPSSPSNPPVSNPPQSPPPTTSDQSFLDETVDGATDVVCDIASPLAPLPAVC